MTLPEGIQVNPSAANGLKACPENAEEGVQGIGYQGPGSDEDPYSTGSAEYPTPEPPRFSPEPARCPPASKIGTVTVHTPLLKSPLHGAVYLAKPAPNGEPGQNPFNSLLALYIVAEEPEAGIRVKLAGEARSTARQVRSPRSSPTRHRSRSKTSKSTSTPARARRLTTPAAVREL